MKTFDFHSIRDEDSPIHSRLLNWSRWALGGKGYITTTPMFRLYRSGDIWSETDRPATIPVDTLDGIKMEHAVADLPTKHCSATRWQYVYSARGMSVWKACRTMSVTPDTLEVLVNDARTLLASRVCPIR